MRTNPWGWARHGVYDQTSHDHQIISIFKILSDISVSIISHLSYLIPLSPTHCSSLQHYERGSHVVFSTENDLRRQRYSEHRHPKASSYLVEGFLSQLRTNLNYVLGRNMGFINHNTATPQSQNSKNIYEIPVTTLTSRGCLGTFLFTFFLAGKSAQLGLVRSWLRNPSTTFPAPAMDRKSGSQIQRQLRLWQRQLMPLFLSRASPLFP